MMRRFTFNDGTEYAIPLRAEIALSEEQQDVYEKVLLNGSLEDQLLARDKIWASVKPGIAEQYARAEAAFQAKLKSEAELA